MVQCLYCGRDLSPRAPACPRCGEPGPAAPMPGTSSFQPGGSPPPPAPGPPSDRYTVESVLATASRTEPYAIASIVCAVANFLGLFVVGAVLAVVFGKMAERRIAENPALEGASLARTGVIVGWVGVGIGALMLLLGITALGIFTNATGNLPVHFTR
jgi:hypothetical protein